MANTISANLRCGGLAAVLMAAGALAAGGASAQAVTYSNGQALKGAAEFGNNCARCHGPQAQGGEGPPLTGTTFAGDWRGKGVADLFEFISHNMPYDDPGGLPLDTYLAILTHLMKLNGIPGGGAALPNPPPAGMIIPK